MQVKLEDIHYVRTLQRSGTHFWKHIKFRWKTNLVAELATKMTFWNQKSSCEVKKKTLYVLNSLKYANGLYCILMIQRRWRITYSFCVWVHLQPHP